MLRKLFSKEIFRIYKYFQKSIQKSKHNKKEAEQVVQISVYLIVQEIYNNLLKIISIRKLRTKRNECPYIAHRKESIQCHGKHSFVCQR